MSKTDDLLRNIAVACLRKASHDPHQALEEFIEEVRDAGGLMCALAEAVGSPEQLALEYLERVARDLSSTLRIFARLVQTPAQKIAASETMRTACSTGAAVRPKGPNGTHRSFHSDQ